MKFSTRLDSAVFQLTPTRTRCDLVIFANGNSEKIASGLVTPFLAHLKTAQDQMAKGGYSIILELEPGSDGTWFTKGTVERFVRFVSTPEVLERVYSLESEILQIEEAIAIQSNNDTGLSAVDDHQAKPVERIEGSKLLTGSNEEKAIVIYKPSSPVPEANGSSVKEGNSKVQLMKVLETRKTVLQKEQGMAFARAVAAGFDIDHMAPLMSFADSFGASRLMDACVRFMELWKRKHETGQWVDIEAADAMSSRSDFAGTNGSGIVLSNAVNKQWPETPDSNKKAEEKLSGDHQQLQPGHQEHFQGQFPHPMFPPWPMHSPPGAVPVFQGYPMQGIPYYQSYPGNNPAFQSPYASGEDPRLNPGQRMGRRHSMDSNTDPETVEVNTNTRYQGDVELEKETPGSREHGRRGSHSAKKKSGVVVIRNINYITAKRQNSSGSESESASETDEENGDQSVSARDSKRKGSHKMTIDKLNSSDREGKTYGKEEDGGHWQAFQTYLLKDADEAERAADQGMFGMEKEARLNRRQNNMGVDPLAFDGRDLGDNQEGNNRDVQNISGNLTRMARGSSEESLISKRMGQSTDGRRFVDTQSAEVDGQRAGYRRNTNDDFVMNTRGYATSSDTLALNRFEHGNRDLDKRSSQNMDDDSYIVSLRSNSLDNVGTGGRNPIDMDSEFPSAGQRVENQVKYEPDDFSLMPERGTQRETTSYDPALDYDGQFHTENNVSLNKRNKEMVTKKSDKDRKSKPTPDTLDRKKTVGPIRRGRPSKLNPMDEARARAEKLRTFKADLQKMKKEKEEEDRKRLEALKIARQKRIASKGGSLSAPSASQPTRKQLPAKISPSSHKGSKFTDSEPGYSSPLQRLPIKPVSAGSASDSQKTSKSNKLNTGSHSAGNRVSRSVSSLPTKKKEIDGLTPDTKPSKDRIRRLSEPKIVSSHQVVSVKPRKSEPMSRPRVSIEPEKKKISAIMNHDKSKAALLPELKIRTTKGQDAIQENAAKEIPLKVNGGTSTSDGGGLREYGNRASNHSDADDNPIIDKTVVMLEPEKPSVPAELHLQKQLEEAKIESVNKVEKESQKISNIPCTEKTYQPPYARVSSFEDPCTGNSEYGKAPPTSLLTVTQGGDAGNFKAHVSDARSLKLEKIPEALDKSQTKESSKGFRRLLKFARKSHTTGESDNGSVSGSEADNGVANCASSSEVHTLKNLISQDETPTAGSTPPKPSRHFSILSPFRSKNSEKKLTA